MWTTNQFSFREYCILPISMCPKKDENIGHLKLCALIEHFYAYMFLIFSPEQRTKTDRYIVIVIFFNSNNNSRLRLDEQCTK